MASAHSDEMLCYDSFEGARTPDAGQPSPFGALELQLSA